MKNIKLLEEKVLARRPILGEILEQFGSMPLAEYAKRYYRAPEYAIDENRKKEFIEAFRAEVEGIFGKEIADSCATQIEKTYHLANVEHHGAIGTSRPLNNALIAASPFLQSFDPEFSNNIIISCANISFNNWTYPRGFMFHTYSNKGLLDGQISFFGHSVDALPLYNYKGFNADTLKNMRKSLYTMWNERFVWKPEYRKLSTLVDEVFASPTVLKQTTYTDQAAQFNYLLWEKISQIVAKPLQKLIFVEQEKLVNRLLIQNHIDKNTTINKILFDPHVLDLVSQHFEGILSAFSEKNQEGTFHFWAIPKGGKYRTQLWRRGNKLVSPDGKYEIELTPEEIKTGIENHELVPSSLLCFMVLSFYYGLRQIGGPNQTTALTQMKEAYIKLLTDAGIPNDIEFCKDVPTTDIIPGMPPVLAFLKGKLGELIAATPLDLYLYGIPTSLDTIAKVSQEVTLGDSIRRTLPLWYKRCYLESERETDLLSITEADIDQHIGLDKKIIPFTTIGDKVQLQP